MVSKRSSESAAIGNDAAKYVCCDAQSWSAVWFAKKVKEDIHAIATTKGGRTERETVDGFKEWLT